MTLTLAGVSTKGSRRSNEDCILACGKVWSNENEPVLFGPTLVTAPQKVVVAVADGMGGHSAGAVASCCVLTWLQEGIEQERELSVLTLRNLISAIHERLVAHGRTIGKPDLGCTLTGVAFDGSRCLVFNVGDSRTYRFGHRFLEPLTKDHSLRALSGDPTIPQNQLYSCLGGGQPDITIDVEELDQFPLLGSSFLLTSDGYHEFPDWDALEAGLGLDPDPTLLAREATAATARGSTDNVTLVHVRLGGSK